MRLVTALLVLSLSIPAFAQTTPKQATPKKPVPVQHVIFDGEGEITGTVIGPDGEVIVGVERPVFHSFNLKRDNFNDKLMASVDEM